MDQPTLLAASILAAAVPTLAYVGLIYWIDRYEKEPAWLLLAAFFWGAVPSILIAYVFNSMLSVPIYLLAGEGAGDALAASLIAPPVEETVKGIALLAILLLWRHELDSPLDGIIYGAMVGMGFAMVENVYYFVNIYAEGGIEAWEVNIFVRGVIFGLNHALFSSMTGLGIAVARMRPHGVLRLAAPLAGWFSAMFLHFLHNLTVSFGNLLCIVALIFDWGGLALTAVIMLWALLQERHWLRTYLADEIAHGTLTPAQYAVACSGRRRNSHRLQLLFSDGPAAYRQASRFYGRCSELAYKKHHHALFQDAKSAQLIDQLRADLLTLGPTLPA
ncbi:MAG: PrsW family intramembrane metalloprotease [Anaerolineales bacterium]|nr:PrsW family intramembrane metalloprotease [Anaerolineales bacterium]